MRPLLLPLLLAVCVGFALADVTMKTVEYKGWKNNLQLSNGTVELIITLDVGPRIIRYGFVGETNIFKEFDAQIGKSGESEWQIRGGHRLWHAPEDLKRTYELDNSPVRYEKLGASGVRLIQPVEPHTGIQKEIDVVLDPNSTKVTVVHRLRNTGMWEVELAPWALTVMAPGGTEIIPLPPKTPHPQGLLPNQQMIVWPYTDLADARWRWGAKYITLSQDNAKGPTKIGLAHKLGWVGYLRDGFLFVKGIEYQEGRRYADNGCNFETFTNQEFLEAESLGPLDRIAPGRAIEHTERWWLFKGIPKDTSDAAIDANIRPKIEAAMK
ncbi:MAG TPA: hypothetical protein VFD58_00790 [Blastocatellia bacterium]|nr:hypothetical protein [Blastocatellia bacterium]